MENRNQINEENVKRDVVRKEKRDEAVNSVLKRRSIHYTPS